MSIAWLRGSRSRPNAREPDLDSLGAEGPWLALAVVRLRRMLAPGRTIPRGASMGARMLIGAARGRRPVRPFAPLIGTARSVRANPFICVGERDGAARPSPSGPAIGAEHDLPDGGPPELPAAIRAGRAGGEASPRRPRDRMRGRP